MAICCKSIFQKPLKKLNGLISALTIPSMVFWYSNKKYAYLFKLTDNRFYTRIQIATLQYQSNFFWQAGQFIKLPANPFRVCGEYLLLSKKVSFIILYNVALKQFLADRKSPLASHSSIKSISQFSDCHIYASLYFHTSRG